MKTCETCGEEIQKVVYSEYRPPEDIELVGYIEHVKITVCPKYQTFTPFHSKFYKIDTAWAE